jgi:hypothetical protein
MPRATTTPVLGRGGASFAALCLLAGCQSAAPPCPPVVPVPAATEARAEPGALDEPKPPPAPSAPVRPLAAGGKPASFLVPDAQCFEPATAGRRFLAYELAPDAADEVELFLVRQADVCKARTRFRVDLLLGENGSERVSRRCGAWRVTGCGPEAVVAALPGGASRSVSPFASLPDWKSIDEQQDGLGFPRPKVQTHAVKGTPYTLMHTRGGYVVLQAGGKTLRHFWADAFVNIDGVPHLVAEGELVRLTDPLSSAPLPSLWQGALAPTPRRRPWEPMN